jgi:hypothetical protein
MFQKPMRFKRKRSNRDIAHGAAVNSFVLLKVTHIGWKYFVLSAG